jgi:RNA polymerase sigma-70 factor (ECF subfamily)
MRRVRRILEAKPSDHRLDQELLEAFAVRGEEGAFTALVHRHDAMVLGVCRRVLNDWHDAEDAFQATFVVLARKAGAIRKQASLASWLYGVANRVSMKARVRLARCRQREREAAQPLASAAAQSAWQELRPVLDEELGRLPDRYRAPLVLCYLEGKTRDEAAQELGWTLGMVKGRLERGRELLRGRLVRRGLTLSAALLVTSMAQTPAPAAGVASLVLVTVKAAMSIAAGQAAASQAVSASVAGLVEGVMKTMLITRLKVAAAILLTMGLVSGSASWLVQQALADKDDQAEPRAVAAPRQAPRDAAKPAKDEEAIQGAWYPTKGEFNGQPAPEEDLDAMRFAVKGDRITLEVAGEKKEIVFKLDATKKPKTMSVTLMDGNEGKNAIWIYELKDKQLTICGSEKADDPAPVEFSAPAKSQKFLIVLGRDKPKRDTGAQKAADERVASRVAQVRSQNNLKQIALAMHNYHGTNGSLPTPAIYSRDGKPLLSWRVAILPYIEQDALYKAFHLDEPWDSAHNKKLLDQMPKTYAPLAGAAKDKHSTFYQVFVGKGTMFEGDKGITFQDVPDGVSNTILVLEAGQAVPWTKPADLDYDAKKPLPKLGGTFKDVFNVAMADGSVHALPLQFKEDVMRRFIIRNDGQPVDQKDLKP